MTASRLRVLSITPLLFVIASCAGAKSAPGSAPSSADTPVVVTRSGGLAGVNDTISVDPQGQWTRTDQTGKQRSGRLTTDEQARLSALADDPGLRAEANRPTSAPNCLDGFNYSLSAGSTRVTYVDCPGDPTRPQTAVSIVDLLTKATS